MYAPLSSSQVIRSATIRVYYDVVPHPWRQHRARQESGRYASCPRQSRTSGAVLHAAVGDVSRVPDADPAGSTPREALRRSSPTPVLAPTPAWARSGPLRRLFRSTTAQMRSPASRMPTETISPRVAGDNSPHRTGRLDNVHLRGRFHTEDIPPRRAAEHREGAGLSPQADPDVRGGGMSGRSRLRLNPAMRPS